jgi:hypothetical protein
LLPARHLPANILITPLVRDRGFTMTSDTWLLLAAFVGFLLLWFIILPRMGLG